MSAVSLQRDLPRARRRLRWGLCALLVALILPSAWLVQRAYRQLAFETLDRYRLAAQSIAPELERAVAQRLAAAVARLDVAPGDPAETGVLGPFRLTAAGELLPVTAGGELPAALRDQVGTLLERLAQPAAPTVAPVVAADDASDPAVQAGLAQTLTNRSVYEQLTARASRSERAVAGARAARDQELAKALSLDDSFLKRQAKQAPAVVAESAELASATVAAGPVLDLSWLTQPGARPQAEFVGSDQVLLYRRQWLQSEPALLGLLIARERLLQAPLAQARRSAAAFPGLALTLLSDQDPARPGDVAGGALLYRARLPRPLDALQIIYSAVPTGRPAGAGVVLAIGALLLVTLLGGFALLYRFAAAELSRRAQQQNFVSAVSHELKSPLTAIRMYGEMLTHDWVPEARKPGYYRYIYSESERLSRLIDNVLRLSALSRGPLPVALEPVSVAALLQQLEPGLDRLAEAAGVALTIDSPPALAQVRIEIDPDALTQVLTNLIDNAGKFAGGGEDRTPVALTLQGLPSNLPGDPQTLQLSLRDWGPGIPESSKARVFELFYRGEDELVRKSRGTGIGLALVAELMRAMNGSVTLGNTTPGAEFLLRLPVLKSAS
ncbi:MAG: HAMP domain-containing sensor histidine kinase [Pseudomonadota bacterium]